MTGILIAKLLLLHSLLATLIVTADSSTLKQSTTGRNRRATSSAVITCGGTAGGQTCVFPFEYNGTTYIACITADRDQLWCATKSGNYNAHGKWGYCVCYPNHTSVHYTCGGTDDKAACIFPFTYKGDQYYGCTSVGHDQPWCATQTGINGKATSWGNCNCPYTPSAVSKTCGGTASDAACVFPFTYRGSQYYVCTSITHNQPWCATQAEEYSSHGKWGNCHCPTEVDSESVPRTCGGSAEGSGGSGEGSGGSGEGSGGSAEGSGGSAEGSGGSAEGSGGSGGITESGACVFPFTYKGKVYNGCTSIGRDQPWCATQAGDYASHHQWGNCRCSSVSSTCSGTADSRGCYFPFIYKSITHYDCTGSRPWCATRSGVYEEHGQWGYCNCKSYSSTCGGTAAGNTCAFPFVYRGIKYYDCTAVEHDQLWCATEEGIYEDHGKWGNCYCPTEIDSIAEIVPRTCGGSAEGSACVFPFTYNGEVYNGCTSIGRDQPWCATQAGDYASHHQWGNCRCSNVSTTCSGTAGSRACYFPFIYQSVTHYDCIGSLLWCATRPEVYEQHNQWGYCNCKSYSSTCGGTAAGNACVFPFVYRGIKYYDCTTANHNQLWCATEKGNYEDHEKWGNCHCPTEVDSESVPRTCGGSAKGSACVFPFTYNGEVYNGCTSIERDQPWCATQAGDYDSHQQWGNCRCSNVPSTCGGTAGSRACYFPFTYQSVTHYDCTGSRPWCATRSGAYEKHGQWGYCNCKSYSSTCRGTAAGNACVFPFVYRDIKYYDCTAANHNQLWCATEEGIYEDHGKWGNCDCSGE